MYLFTDASEKENSADFALADFYDSIGAVPTELVEVETNVEGSVDDNLVIVQWKEGNNRTPCEGVILFKGIACTVLVTVIFKIQINNNLIIAALLSSLKIP